MGHLLVMPKTKDIKYIDKIDGIIVGLKDYSIHSSLVLSLDEIKKLREQYLDKKVFIVINKNLENNDIVYMEEILCTLNEIGINGVFFYDIAILSIKKRLGLSLDLVWNQTHMVTNYNTCNYYLEEGVRYAFLSSEITVEEMTDIKKSSSIIPMVYVFGKNVVAHSKRSLLSNYFKHYQKEKKKDAYVIKENVTNVEYTVKEGNLGTTIVNNTLLNGVNAVYDLKKVGIEYFILEEVCEKELFEEVIACHRQILEDKNEKDREKNVEIMKELIHSDYEGFFYKKTIYKVKKDG